MSIGIFYDDSDGGLRRLTDQIRRDERAKRETIPQEFRHRRAETLSPQENDRMAAIFGTPREHWSRVEKAQKEWASDPNRVAAREADILSAMRKIADEIQAARAKDGQ